MDRILKGVDFVVDLAENGVFRASGPKMGALVPDCDGSKWGQKVPVIRGQIYNKMCHSCLNGKIYFLKFLGQFFTKVGKKLIYLKIQ